MSEVCKTEQKAKKKIKSVQSGNKSCTPLK